MELAAVHRLVLFNLSGVDFEFLVTYQLCLLILQSFGSLLTLQLLLYSIL